MEYHFKMSYFEFISQFIEFVSFKLFHYSQFERKDIKYHMKDFKELVDGKTSPFSHDSSHNGLKKMSSKHEGNEQFRFFSFKTDL